MGIRVVGMNGIRIPLRRTPVVGKRNSVKQPKRQSTQECVGSPCQDLDGSILPAKIVPHCGDRAVNSSRENIYPRIQIKKTCIRPRL
jgi:hypothetical protein